MMLYSLEGREGVFSETELLRYPHRIVPSGCLAPFPLRRNPGGRWQTDPYLSMSPLFTGLPRRQILGNRVSGTRDSRKLGDMRAEREPGSMKPRLLPVLLAAIVASDACAHVNLRRSGLLFGVCPLIDGRVPLPIG